MSDLARGDVATTFGGGRFNSPNDLTVRADGTVYFTDPNFQRGRRPDELAGTTGVFRVSDGQVFLVDDTVAQPNGVALSPDGRFLYVGGSADNRIFRYPVNADGSTGRRTEFATITEPDGVTVDCAGNLYWASFNDGRIHVLSPAGAELGTIGAGRNTTNAAFSDADGRTLYITSGTPTTDGPGAFALYRIRLGIPGNPF